MVDRMLLKSKNYWVTSVTVVVVFSFVKFINYIEFVCCDCSFHF